MKTVIKNIKNLQDELQTVKGFRDISGDEYFRQKGAIEKAEDVALYYGFSPLEIPMVEFTSIFERGVGMETDIVQKELFNMKTKGGDQRIQRRRMAQGSKKKNLCKAP